MSKADGRMSDPYEVYYRRARRRDRTEVAVVAGGLFLALILVLVVVLFRMEVDQRATLSGQENIVLNN